MSLLSSGMPEEYCWLQVFATVLLMFHVHVFAGDPYDRYYAAKLESTPALGSSGAINSIVMFDIMMAPTATVMIYGILPMHAWILGGLFLYQDINGALGVSPLFFSALPLNVFWNVV